MDIYKKVMDKLKKVEDFIEIKLKSYLCLCL